MLNALLFREVHMPLSRDHFEMIINAFNSLAWHHFWSNAIDDVGARWFKRKTISENCMWISIVHVTCYMHQMCTFVWQHFFFFFVRSYQLSVNKLNDLPKFAFSFSSCFLADSVETSMVVPCICLSLCLQNIFIDLFFLSVCVPKWVCVCFPIY